MTNILISVWSHTCTRTVSSSFGSCLLSAGSPVSCCVSIDLFSNGYKKALVRRSCGSKVIPLSGAERGDRFSHELAGLRGGLSRRITDANEDTIKSGDASLLVLNAACRDRRPEPLTAVHKPAVQSVHGSLLPWTHTQPHQFWQIYITKSPKVYLKCWVLALIWTQISAWVIVLVWSDNYCIPLDSFFSSN